MEKSTENSQQQAAVINVINLHLGQLDLDYLKEAADDMLNAANRQESMAVLNPSHPQVKNDLLRQQGKALLMLTGYIEAVNKCTELKLRVEVETEQRSKIAKLFF